MLVTNKRYDLNKTATVQMKLTADIDHMAYFDPMPGETTELAVVADGTVTVKLVPGASGLLFLPEGMNAFGQADR